MFPLTNVMRLKRNFFSSRDKSFQKSWQRTLVGLYISQPRNALDIIINNGRKRRRVIQALMARKDPYTVSVSGTYEVFLVVSHSYLL